MRLICLSRRGGPVCCLALALLALLSACGSSGSGPPAIATVGNGSIDRSTYQEYVRYAASYYAAATSAGSESPAPATCSPSVSSCARTSRQVLRRLLEERVILDYAQSHHIVLTIGGQRAIRQDLAGLELVDTPTGLLLRNKRVTISFLRSLLTTEALVRKVEQTVVPRSAIEGDSFHLQSISILFFTKAERAKAYSQAFSLATDGRPIPAAASVRVSWVAAFRLSARVRTALVSSSRGQWVGPFRRHHAYIVIQLLARETHLYGRPVRFSRETVFFRRWLEQQLAAAHPHCFTDGGKSTSCPPADH